MSDDQTDPFNNQPQDDASASPQNDDSVTSQLPQDDSTASPQLPQDFDTPAADPTDVDGSLHVDHPTTDTSVDRHQRYDENQSNAAIDNPATTVSEPGGAEEPPVTSEPTDIPPEQTDNNQPL